MSARELRAERRSASSFDRLKRSLAALVAFAVIGVLAGCPFTALTPIPAAPGGANTTLILVRHAERDPGLDPPLNAEGQARALVLGEVLSEQGVTAIFSPDLLRNRQTAQAVSDRTGVPITLYSPTSFVDTTAFATQVLADIRERHAGGSVLFVGNIGSAIPTPGILDELYRLLGGTGRKPNRYQDMYIAVIPADGPTRFIKTIYGGRSSLDPA